MEKSRIFIASSGRALVLAEKLRDDLQTDFCEARVWTEESRDRPSAVIVEMLERATREYDFAVVILAKDDLMTKGTGETLKARDNCVFEAGLFMASLGRERCFLMNSVEQWDLPSDLAGIISLPFQEPPELTNRDACAQAIRGPSAEVKDAVQRLGRVAGRSSTTSSQVPQLLAVDDVFNRERPISDGGDLREGQVLVCDVQPVTRLELAAQIRRNIDFGVSYLYFLHNSEDTVEKVFQALQLLLLAQEGRLHVVADFRTRIETLTRDRAEVLRTLRSLCNMRSLTVSLLPEELQFRFRLHNATDPEHARLYMKWRGDAFVQWAEGSEAVKVWTTTMRYFPSIKTKSLFVPMTNFALTGEQERQFEDSVDRALCRYFPGIEDEVRRLCYGNGILTPSGGLRPVGG